MVDRLTRAPYGHEHQMIDSTDGHLAQDAEDQDRGLLDALRRHERAGRGHVVGTESELGDECAETRYEKPPPERGFCVSDDDDDD